MTINLEKDLLCFSHLRWDFVFQRPQHLMTQFAEITNVFFWEEPLPSADGKPYLSIQEKRKGLWLCIPYVPAGLTSKETTEMMNALLQSFFEERDCGKFIFWYYTPMAFEFSGSFEPDMTVYDCMDELSAFKFAPARISYIEQQLLKRADLVFTGGASLYEAKKASHHNIYSFPSSIDKAHFGAARNVTAEPEDQVCIRGVKLGFYGVIDERFDRDLIREIAAKRPDWQIILIGPVVKIDPSELPEAGNIHYLGSKCYEELPAYLSGWDVAMIPFLLNESTRYISPTKTPEYLAAGKPVVSTAIRDVVRPYAQNGLVSIGYDAAGFIQSVENELGRKDKLRWMRAVDAYLSDKSWRNTFSAMLQHMTRRPVKPVALVSELKNAS